MTKDPVRIWFLFQNRWQLSVCQETKIFIVWLKKYLEVNASIEEAKKGISKIKTTEEAKSIPAQTIKELKKDWFEEGVEKGILKGREEGRQEGMKKGIIDDKKATAKAMKKEKIDLNTIAKVTGLSISVIKKL